MLSVFYADFHIKAPYSECRYAECRYAACRLLSVMAPTLQLSIKTMVKAVHLGL
jgi:hypothetical protein